MKIKEIGIAIVAPSGHTRDDQALRRGIARLDPFSTDCIVRSNSGWRRLTLIP